MVKQLQEPFEKFVDWWKCAAVMKKEEKHQNSRALQPVHEIYKRPYMVSEHRKTVCTALLLQFRFHEPIFTSFSQHCDYGVA
jgi:hypothetical protein